MNGGIPFVIAHDMKARLATWGFTPGEIFNMTPAEAHGALQKLDAAFDAAIQEFMGKLNLGRATVTTLFGRAVLLDKGFAPIPYYGEEPPVYRRATWQGLELVTFGQLRMWAHTWPDAHDTGVLTRTTPMLNIDVSDPDAAAAVEDLVRERFGDSGRILVRFPRRGIPLRTAVPFPGAQLAFDGVHKLEFAGAGSHTIVAGTQVSWFGGTPGEGVAHADLPLIDAAGAHELLASAARLLVDKRGLRSRAPVPPSHRGVRTAVPAGVVVRDAAWRAARWRELQSVPRRGV
jgi:hypothetical protein